MTRTASLDRWQSFGVPAPGTIRNRMSCNLDDSTIALVGGFDMTTGSLTTACHLFNGIEFIEIASLNYPRGNIGNAQPNNNLVRLSDGRLWVQGSNNYDTTGLPANTAEIYDPVADTWTVDIAWRVFMCWSAPEFVEIAYPQRSGSGMTLALEDGSVLMGGGWLNPPWTWQPSTVYKYKPGVGLTAWTMLGFEWWSQAYLSLNNGLGDGVYHYSGRLIAGTVPLRDGRVFVAYSAGYTAIYAPHNMVMLDLTGATETTETPFQEISPGYLSWAYSLNPTGARYIRATDMGQLPTDIHVGGWSQEGIAGIQGQDGDMYLFAFDTYHEKSVVYRLATQTWEMVPAPPDSIRPGYSPVLLGDRHIFFYSMTTPSGDGVYHPRSGSWLYDIVAKAWVKEAYYDVVTYPTQAGNWNEIATGLIDGIPVTLANQGSTSHSSPEGFYWARNGQIWPRSRIDLFSSRKHTRKGQLWPRTR